MLRNCSRDESLGPAYAEDGQESRDSAGSLSQDAQGAQGLFGHSRVFIPRQLLQGGLGVLAGAGGQGLGDWKVVSLHDEIPGVVLNITDKIRGWEPSAEKLPMPTAIPSTASR